MTAWPVREAWAGRKLDLRSPGAWGRDLAVAAVIGVWIGLLGPFGNYLAGPLGMRIAFQLVLAAICVGVFGLALPLAVQSGARIGLPPWISTPLAAAAICLPLTVIKASVGVAFFPRLKRILTPLDWCAETFLLILPIVCAYAALLYLLGRRRPAMPAAAGAPAGDGAVLTTGRPRLHDRLPGAPSGDILALQVEDHYVRVYTGSGSHLLLMRLSDAIAEMEGVEGLRTHRSWWVARGAVCGVRLNGRGGRVTLPNGVQAPVARSALASIKASGWS